MVGVLENHRKWIGLGLIGALLIGVVTLITIMQNKPLSLSGSQPQTSQATPPQYSCPKLQASDKVVIQKAVDMYESGLTLKGGVMLRNILEQYLGARPDLNSKDLLAIAKELLKC